VSLGSDPEKPAVIAIDLGAESCRVSLLSWREHAPSISMVRRFENSPEDHGQEGLRWNLDRICGELERGLRTCAELVPEGIASIGVTGWAVDYVRLDASGRPLAQPFCYRDERAQAAFKAVHAIVPAPTLYGRTGVQIQPINTIYQLYADKSSGVASSAPWVNLPEYILHWLGAPRIAESTNATHTGLIDADTREWSGTLFEALGLDIAAAPKLVSPGTALGPLRADLRHLPAFATTQLVTTPPPPSLEFRSAPPTGPTSVPEPGLSSAYHWPTACALTNRIPVDSLTSARRTAASSSIAASPACGYCANA
jgi:rhamnulokinase